MFKRLLFTTILGFLMICTARAGDVVIQKLPKNAKGYNNYIIMIETATGKHCWGIPQNLDYNALPDKPMDIEAAAKRFKWKEPVGKQSTACKALMRIVWKVYSNQDQATQPVYQITDNKDKTYNKVTDTVIDNINTNTVCGGYVNTYGISEDLTWRMVTGNTGKRGAALCKKSK